ncbi:MAG: chorismate mutase [Spirochaetota bacterium]|jgi:chorismate mutase/prephenate dehydratase|nr:chorismate mutase [Spirochaetota bacterium]
MDLQDYREHIDKVDDALLQLFKERMDISQQIAEYKKEHGLPALDSAREREKLAAMGEKAGDALRSYSYMLYSMLFELSRARQGSILHPASELSKTILSAAEHTERVFPQHALAACQGAEGAYAQIACDRLFTEPNILYFTSFDAVFGAIRDGLCQYGVLPLENSAAGSVNMVYDLMMRYSFKIARSVRLKIDHNLLAKEGVKKNAIREIFSHEQAINQCAGYLKSLGKDVKITAAANTAEAAKMVAESGRSDVAALASRSCCELYGLKCVESSVQDGGINYTRFICISRDLEIYPGADRTSIMLTTAHKPGALYRVLGRIYTLGVNIVKLESRPIPDRDFEFMFYFDLETSIYSKQFSELICELENMCEEFHYLGSYTEIV